MSGGELKGLNRLDSVENSEEEQESEVFIEADFHAHTSNSDGPPLINSEEQAQNANLAYLGLVDHANLSKRSTVHDTPDWTESTEESFTDENWNSARRYEINRISQSYESTEYEDVVEALETFNGNYIEQEVQDILNSVNQTPLDVLGDGIELDYEAGDRKIFDFFKDNEFDYAMTSVHFIDETYIKSEEEVLDYIFNQRLENYSKKFKDKEQLDDDKAREIIKRVEEEKEDIIEGYFDNLSDLISSETLFWLGNPVIVAHPDLIERNSVLNDKIDDKRYDEIIEKSKNSIYVLELSGKSIERQIPEEKVNPYKEAYKPGTDKSKEDITTENTEDLIEAVEESESTAFIRKLMESDIDFVYGSDAHRDWEIPARKHMAEEILEHWGAEPLNHKELFRRH